MNATTQSRPAIQVCCVGLMQKLRVAKTNPRTNLPFLDLARRHSGLTRMRACDLPSVSMESGFQKTRRIYTKGYCELVPLPMQNVCLSHRLPPYCRRKSNFSIRRIVGKDYSLTNSLRRSTNDWLTIKSGTG